MCHFTTFIGIDCEGIDIPLHNLWFYPCNNEDDIDKIS